MVKSISGFPRKWVPINKDKYDGNYNSIVVRSSWEVRFLNWCDRNSAIKSYSSEEIVIPYISPIDQKTHRYFPDAKITTNDNKVFIVEIKPFKEIKPPRQKSKYYLSEATTFMVNQAKWKAARVFCDRYGWEFKLITEYELGLKNSKSGTRV